jgi:hypothetical protein
MGGHKFFFRPSHSRRCGSRLGLVAAGLIALALLPKADAQDPRYQPPETQLVNPNYTTAEDMQRLAHNLDTVKRMLDVAQPVIDKDDDFRRLNHIVEFGQKFADLAAAIKLDIAERRDIFSDSSHTVSKLAEFSLSAYIDSKQLQVLADLGLISQKAVSRFGFVSFGASEIVGSIGTIAGEGRVRNINALENGLDGISATLWGIYGFLAFPEQPDVVQAFASSSRLAATVVRDMTLPAFEGIVSKVSGLDGRLVEIWKDAQHQRIARGQSAISIQDFYGRDPSILGKFNAGELARANAYFGLPSPAPRITATQSHSRETCNQGPCSQTEFPLTPDSGGRRVPPLGGIRLDSPVSGAALRGITIDPASGNIILLAERDFLVRGLSLRDLAMALWLEFGPDGPQDAQFSLDPDDPQNPTGPWLRAVYMPPTLQGRTIGAELFSGDLVLKELAFEAMLSPQGKLVPRKSKVPGFRSYAQLTMDDAKLVGGHEQFARWWIVADRVTSQRAGDTLLFEAHMAVKARRQIPDPSSTTGLRDVDTQPDALEAVWARQLTARYDELSQEVPALARIKELAKVVAVAKSLRAAGTRIDLARVAAIVNGDNTRTIGKINAFSVTLQREQRTPFLEGNREGMRIRRQELHLFGGVDLSSVHPIALSDNGSARAIAASEKAAFDRAGPGEKVFNFEYDHAQLIAVELPLLLRN